MLGAKVLPPNYARSATVHNEASKPVNVKIVYRDEQNNKEIEDSITVDANAVKEIPEKTIDMGSWQAVAPVKSVTVQDSNHSLTPTVTGVVRTVHVHVKPSLNLEQGATN